MASNIRVIRSIRESADEVFQAMRRRHRDTTVTQRFGRRSTRQIMPFKHSILLTFLLGLLVYLQKTYLT
jgi:hypothetical protein